MNANNEMFCGDISLVKCIQSRPCLGLHYESPLITDQLIIVTLNFESHIIIWNTILIINVML